MEWIDIVATVVARRHAHCNPTTASVDNLQFKEAVHLNNTLIIEGKLTYVGRTSMEVRVDTFVESLSGARKLVNTAYVVMVALDENEHPMEVPGLLVETDEEKAEWEAGVKRNDLRKHRRAENTVDLLIPNFRAAVRRTTNRQCFCLGKGICINRKQM